MSKKKPGRAGSSVSGQIIKTDKQTAYPFSLLDVLDRPNHVVDTDLRIVFISQAFRKWCRTIKFELKDAVGKTFNEVFPFLPSSVVDEYLRVLKTAKPVITREDQIISDGRLFYTETIKVPLVENDRVTHILTVINDLTEQVMAQDALKASEAKYRLLVENVNAHISLLDRDGIFLFVNGVAARASGVTPEQVLGKSLWDFFPADIADKQIASIREVIDSGQKLTTPMKLKLLDKWCWFDVNIQPYRGQKGRIEAAMVIAIDITEYQMTKEALRSSVTQSRLLIDNVQAHIVLADYDGVFLFSNRSGAAAMGLEPEEMIGKRQEELFPPEVAQRQIANIRGVIDSQKEFREETQMFIGGRRRWYDINIQPYSDAIYGEKTALIIIIDITERRQAEEELRQSEERFRLQFRSLPIPSYIWEHNGVDFILTSYNVAAEEITSGKITDFIGITLTEMYGASPEIIEDMNRCLSEKTTITREMSYHMRSTGKDKFLRLFYVYVPPNLVVAHTEDITEHRSAATALQEAHDELEKRVRMRTEELAEANEALRVEREALEQKNIALREVLDQIEEGKKQMASQIQSNINRIALPILKSLEGKTRASNKKYIELLQTSLSEIASPLIGTLEAKFAQLTPRELEVCNLVKNGFSSKEIADTFSTSVQTVLKQRAIIRKKLGIANDKMNLTSYLKSLE